MDQDNTVEKISGEIERLALEGDFVQAEQWHAVLLKKHPTAIKEIISSATLIEEQKTIRLDHEHLEIWGSLYSQLSQEEKNCLFYSTRNVTIPSGKLLLRQGTLKPRLFFIDSGRVILFHTKDKERILIGDLGRGDVVGDETFFSHSTPTFSAGCKTDVRLRYLDKSMTDKWKETCPGLERLVADFCLKNSRANQLLMSKKIEKRQFTRAKNDEVVRAYLCAENGARSQENIRGTLTDISRNGVSFDIHSSKAENARKLLGRDLELDFERLLSSSGEPFSLRGTVVKVTVLLHNDFILHLQLADVIQAEEFEKHFSQKGS